MKKTLFIFWLLATAIGLLAQDGFLCQETRLSREQWEAGAARLSSLRPASTTADPRPRFGLLGKEGATSIGNYADEAGPEIESLARGLLNDPLRIYNHVHDQIEYEHYFGCKKGALMTLLEGRGNDFDQCTLLVSLLRTSGYQASYVLGFMEIPYESPDGYDMKAWIGFRPSFDPANPDLVSDLVSSFLRNRGTPLTAFLTQTKTVLLPRVWVRAVVDGKRCDLDPSFKRRQFSPALDWASAINLNRQGLLDACRGTAGQNYASGLDGAALSRYLAAKTGDFLAWLHREHPNLTSGELFGQPVSVRDSLTALPASLRFNLITNADLGRLGQLNFPPAVFESVPETLMSLFAIESDANHVRMPFPWLADKTLTLTMDRLLNGVPQASVRVNDDLLDGMQEISGTGNFLHLKLSFLHPHGTLDLTSNTIITNGISDEVETLDLRRYLAVPGRIPCYAFSHAFSPSAKLLRRWTDRLQDRLRNGEPSNSMPVVRESLNVLGLNYWLQCRDVMSFTARLRGMDHLNAHLCLIVGQSEGYYLDVKALTAKTLSLTGRAAADNRVADEALSTSAFFSSALEHGVIEQQPGYTNRAASTIRVLQRANELGLKIYFSENADDYVHHIQSNLRHYPDPSPITAAATNGCLLLFPEDGNIGIGSGTWKGFGYVSWRLSTNQDRIAAMAMMLNGEVGGGMTDNQCLINPGPVSEGAKYQADGPDGDANPTTAQPTGADPVRFSDGSFLLEHEDLRLGSNLPRGLSFRRHYASRSRFENRVGLGYGWTHNGDIRLEPVTAAATALAGQTPEQMAALLVASAACKELLSGVAHLEARDWLAMVLTTGWAIDLVRSNAVVVTLGQDRYEFIRQPDGAYTPPPGLTLALSTAAGRFVLEQRHGNKIFFDGLNRAGQIQNPRGLSTGLTYYDSGQLRQLKDAYGRTLDFTYGYAGQLLGVSDSSGRAVKFQFDAAVNLVQVVDPEGAISSYQYDSLHQILASYDPYGRIITANDFDDDGRVLQQRAEGNPAMAWSLHYAEGTTVEVDPLGAKTTHVFDPFGREVGVIDPLGRGSQIAYDGENQVIQTTSPGGAVSRFEYDARHNLLRTIDPLGHTQRHTYDDQDRLIASVDARGQTRSFQYSAWHELTRSVDPLGHATVLQYNADGTLAGSQDPGGFTTSYTYGNYGQLSGIRYPDGAQEELVRNALGDVLSFKDARGYISQREFNRRRQLLKQVAPDKSVTSFQYDLAGNLAVATDAKGNSISNVYSSTRRLFYSLLPALPQGVPIVQYLYDTHGRKVAVIDPLQQTNWVGYNLAGESTATRDPLGRILRMAYDPDGRLSRITNALGQIQSYDYNALGLPIGATDPAGKTLGYGRDEVGNLLTLTNRRGQVFTLEYDPDNRPVKSSTPNGNTTTRAYDARGLPLTVTLPSGGKTSLAYDERGRLIQRADGVGVTTYHYAPDGLLTNVVENGNELRWEFDGRQRVVRYQAADHCVIGYEYDANGNLSTLTYPDGKTVHYDYDGQNRVTLVTDWAGRQTRFDYDLAGRLTRTQRPNGTTRSVQYDVAGQLIQIQESKGTGEIIVLYKIAWDLGGRIRREFQAPLPHAPSISPATMVYDADNRLRLFNGQAVAHDADGNMVHGPLAEDRSSTFTYDARNRLVEAGGLTYQYDALGNRIGISGTNGVIRLTINPNAPLSQVLVRVKPGEKTVRYVYGAGLLYETDDSDQPRFYHADYRGSTVAITDQSGTVIDRVDYTTYGTISWRTAATDTPFLFHGAFGVQTDANGLIHMRARYYHPRLGRFLNADPSGFYGGMNWYAFADNDPSTFLDPSGLGSQETSNQNGLHISFRPDLMIDQMLSDLKWMSPAIVASIMIAPYLAAVFPEAVSLATGIVYGLSDTPLNTSPAVSTVEQRLVNAAEGEGAFANYMRQAQTLDVSTAPNGAVFYSGPGNRALAEQFAIANGRTTLEMTPGGAWLDQQQLFNTAQSGLTTEQAAQVWSTLSQRFAQGASGNAVGFVNGARAGSIFNTVESPALFNNPNVVNVITGGH